MRVTDWLLLTSIVGSGIVGARVGVGEEVSVGEGVSIGEGVVVGIGVEVGVAVGVGVGVLFGLSFIRVGNHKPATTAANEARRIKPIAKVKSLFLTIAIILIIGFVVL